MSDRSARARWVSVGLGALVLAAAAALWLGRGPVDDVERGLDPGEVDAVEARRAATHTYADPVDVAAEGAEVVADDDRIGAALDEAGGTASGATDSSETGGGPAPGRAREDRRPRTGAETDDRETERRLTVALMGRQAERLRAEAAEAEAAGDDERADALRERASRTQRRSDELRSELRPSAR